MVSVALSAYESAFVGHMHHEEGVSKQKHICAQSSRAARAPSKLVLTLAPYKTHTSALKAELCPFHSTALPLGLILFIDALIQNVSQMSESKPPHRIYRQVLENVGVGSLLPPRGSQKMNSVSQTW